ncbi:tRNA (N6-threonylcarbamoyladenosine(37)-N6)-methyltransferase TrmO [Faecalicatena contorta]|uniref:tRNA (N6-threonylcarbamoyladenosine(37)-N6)-methyltransferase TrmO n=1 Tax=Faecalicatena contorta TaxID=39482 RepID=UPI001EED95EA|nr:tRNA (N6-threonylcarbamoyladenosine(37)-N6)-methyltransferase TrmO [Faecalicatena contorta]MCF2553773.1 tRNA (N6-threonylcarbamoyladenosine(37)-N6)-methyltransferase TrmO [Faecalicatena contorta]
MCESIQRAEGIALRVIARIYTDFPTKFGIPRQSGLADTPGYIVFEPEYRSPEALRGIEEFSRLWLIWGFSRSEGKKWSPTVRPPRLGGNERVGVFATRSPFRPNPLGLSCVKLLGTRKCPDVGQVLLVEGADMVSGTPIYDIKPYLPYVDAYPDAEGGFAHREKEYALQVELMEPWRSKVPEDKREVLVQILSQDPRPSYQNDPERIYGMEYAGMEVKFRVEGDVLQVCGIYRKLEHER